MPNLDAYDALRVIYYALSDPEWEVLRDTLKRARDNADFKEVYPGVHQSLPSVLGLMYTVEMLEG